MFAVSEELTLLTALHVIQRGAGHGKQAYRTIIFDLQTAPYIAVYLRHEADS